MDNYFNPVKVICGENSLMTIPSLLSNIVSENKNVLIISWNTDIFKMEAFENINTKYNAYFKCFNESNPTVEQLFDLYLETKDINPEVVIAVGGGSVMDVGKSLCCFYNNKIDTVEEMRQMIVYKSFGRPSAKWIGVPTTSGTGSEVTCWATIWDPSQNAKRSVESIDNYAYAAVVDTELTKNMPVKLAVSSALDAVAHAVESYWANASNVVSRSHALGAIKKIMYHIDELIDGNNDAHKYMAEGSMLAGLAFSNTKTTACHSISYPLTMKYNIPHGIAVSMLIAPVLKINFDYILDADVLLEALGVKSADEFEKRITEILKRAEIPATLEEWNVLYDDIKELAKLGITKGRADNNPVNLTEEKIENILIGIYR